MIMMMINLTKEKRNPKLQEQIDLIHEILYIYNIVLFLHLYSYISYRLNSLRSK